MTWLRTVTGETTSRRAIAAVDELLAQQLEHLPLAARERLVAALREHGRRLGLRSRNSPITRATSAGGSAASPFEDVAEHVRQLGRVHVLEEVADAPARSDANRSPSSARDGEHDDLGLRQPRADLPRRRDAAARHAHVENADARAARAPPPRSRPARRPPRRRPTNAARLLERRADVVARRDMVVGEQDPDGRWSEDAPRPSSRCRGRGFDVERAADGMRSLAHADQPEAFPASEHGRRVEAAAVVADAKSHAPSPVRRARRARCARRRGAPRSTIASQAILISASRAPVVELDAGRQNAGRAASPSRSAVSRAASASATSSGSSSGFVSAAMARRDSVSARAAARGRASDRLVVARRAGGAFLPMKASSCASAVVQVAGQAPPLLEHGRVRERRPVRADLPCGGGEDRDVERKPEEVARVDVVRVQRRVEEVVQAREGSEQRLRRRSTAAARPPSRAPGAPKPIAAKHVEAHPGELCCEQAHVPLEPRPRRVFRRQDSSTPVGSLEPRTATTIAISARTAGSESAAAIVCVLLSAEAAPRRDRGRREEHSSEKLADQPRPGAEPVGAAAGDRRDRREEEVGEREQAERVAEREVVQLAASAEAAEDEVCDEQADQRSRCLQRDVQLGQAVREPERGDEDDRGTWPPRRRGPQSGSGSEAGASGVGAAAASHTDTV